MYVQVAKVSISIRIELSANCICLRRGGKRDDFIICRNNSVRSAKLLIGLIALLRLVARAGTD